MRIFFLHLVQFLIFPLICFFLSFFIKTDIDKKREMLNALKVDRNLIIMGDSKAVVDFNYYLLKDCFPNYNIINISIWPKNPQFNYSVYQDILKKKKMSNSIIIYNSTFRHTLNRVNKEWEPWDTKAKIDALLGESYKFKHIENKNGFVNITTQNFRDIKVVESFYKSLENQNDKNFIHQINYLRLIQELFEKGDNNLFLICELPFDSTVEQLHLNSQYYSSYKKSMTANFETKFIYFGYIPILNKSTYWFDRDHLKNSGTIVFTPLFCDSLQSKITNLQSGK